MGEPITFGNDKPGDLVWVSESLGVGELLRFTPGGDIFVRGRLAANDIEVVDALREFLGVERLAK